MVSVPKEGDNGRISGFFWPDLALDFQYLSLGTTGVRLGPSDFLYGEVAWANAVPIFSGKGAVRAGIGFPLHGSFRSIWLGANVIPYSKPGAACQLEYLMTPTQSIVFAGRYGEYKQRPEFGVSLGLRYHFAESH